MNEKLKNYFWIAATVALLSGSYGAVSYVKSYAKSIQPTSFRSFAVSGEGKAVSVPDVAEFNFSVITEGGKNVAELQKQNTEKVNKAIEYVKSQKVDSKDIKTVGYSLEPRYQYVNCYGGDGRVCPPPEIVGYSIQQTVAVKARDFSKVGDILTGVVQNGANSVSSLNFTMDDPTAAENQAREEAIKKAKDKAKDVAKAGGFRLGRLIAIEEGYSGGVPIYGRMETLSKDGIGGGGDSIALPAPVIEPGSQETVINVTLRYEIE